MLSDISALSYGYRYEYKKLKQNPDITFTNNITLKIYLRFNNRDELSSFNFRSIDEQYAGGDYHYVVGTIALNELIKNKQLISNNKLFAAVIGDDIHLSETKKTEKQKEVLTA